jgi:hypothetical protein
VKLCTGELKSKGEIMSRIILACALAGILSVPAIAQTSVEDIYVVRSVHETSADVPTEFCAKARTGVERATLEWRYTLRSVSTSTLDGSVLDTNVKTIGGAHSCFGPTANPAIFEFYGEFSFDHIAFNGLGECQLGKPDFPEKGLTFSRCLLDLSGLPVEYVGGRLTTNSMGSRNAFGTQTDPPGYIQSSIATIRLWKKRVQ